jgi:hypothetical protein
MWVTGWVGCEVVLLCIHHTDESLTTNLLPLRGVACGLSAMFVARWTCMWCSHVALVIRASMLSLCM